MAEFSDRELKILETGGFAIAAVGLLLALFTLIPHDPNSFWDEFIRGLHGSGLVAMGAGVVWGALAALHRRTSFFRVEAPIDSQQFGVSVAAIGVLALAALVILLYLLPSTPAERLPANPKEALRIVTQQKTVRAVVSLAIISTAAVLASFPCRRFFRK